MPPCWAKFLLDKQVRKVKIKIGEKAISDAKFFQELGVFNYMPMTKKGEKIMHAMMKEYGSKKGKKVFYASENKGTIKGVAKHRRLKKAVKRAFA